MLDVGTLVVVMLLQCYLCTMTNVPFIVGADSWFVVTNFLLCGILSHFLDSYDACSCLSY